MKKLSIKSAVVAITLSLASFPAIAGKQEIVDFEYAESTLANYYGVFAACKHFAGFKEQDYYKAARDDIQEYFDINPDSEDEIVFETLKELRVYEKPAIMDVNVCHTLKDMARDMVRKSFSGYNYE